MPDVFQEIEAIAIREDRSRSKVLEKLILRGLAAYRRDGRLDEPATEIVGPDAITEDEIGAAKLPARKAEKMRKAG